MLYRQMFFLGIILSQILFLAPPSTAQTREWTRLCGTDSTDVGHGVAVDVGGDVYVAGSTNSALDGQPFAGIVDFCLVKYDSSGTKLWTRLCGSPGTDVAHGVAVDASKSVYVTGNIWGALDGQPYAGSGDICLVKYDSSGTKLWTRLCGTVSNDVGYGVTVDRGGNVYVTGYTYGALDGQTNAGGSDICLVKYDSSGTKLWTRLCGSPDGDYGYGVAVDRGGNVYVTGVTYGTFDGQTNAGGWDICLVKYDSSGTKLWTRLCGTVGNDNGNGVAVDASDNVYVTGCTVGTLDGQANAGSWDICLVKYDSSGTKLWTRLCGSDSSDWGYGVAVDAGKNVYITGCTAGALDGQTNAGSWDICLVKYDSNGTKLWTRLCGSDSSDYGYGVVVDAGGNMYVTGATVGVLDGQTNAGGTDVFIVKYTQRTQILPFITRSLPNRMANDIQMFDISGRRISSKDLLRRPAGIYLVRSKSASFCEVKMRVK